MYVLDACAMIAYVRGELGEQILTDLMADRDNEFAAHSVNMAEVYYHFLRESGQQDAELAVEPFEKGIAIRSDGDGAFWRDVARLKAPGRIALADCFCVALARRLEATVVTTDRTELAPVQAAGECSVLFLR
jgi:predicted nucleic acid-binding protein